MDNSTSFPRAANGWFAARFPFQEKQYRLEIYSDTMVMHEGRHHRYEAYMSEESASEQAMIEGFATRLDRMLSGGQWAGFNERGSPAWLRRKVRKHQTTALR